MTDVHILRPRHAAIPRDTWTTDDFSIAVASGDSYTLIAIVNVQSYDDIVRQSTGNEVGAPGRPQDAGAVYPDVELAQARDAALPPPHFEVSIHDVLAIPGDSSSGITRPGYYLVLEHGFQRLRDPADARDRIRRREAESMATVILERSEPPNVFDSYFVGAAQVYLRPDAMPEASMVARIQHAKDTALLMIAERQKMFGDHKRIEIDVLPNLVEAAGADPKMRWPLRPLST